MLEGYQITELLETLMAIGGFVLVMYSPIARALGNRILHGRAPREGTGSIEAGRVDDLSGEVAATRRHLDELQERVDFAERLLAQARERGLLNAGER